MVGFVEAFLKALDSYKKHPLESIALGIVYSLLGIITIIPILGAFIGAYLFPRLLSWFYNKVFGNISADHRISFRVWLFYLLLMNLAVFQLILYFYLLLTSVYNITSRLSAFDIYLITEGYKLISEIIVLVLGIFISIIQLFVLQVFITYTLYSVVLGRLNEFRIDIGKSLVVFGYAFGWGIVFSIIDSVLGMIPLYGHYISILFNVLFALPIIQLVIAHKVLSL